MTRMEFIDPDDLPQPDVVAQGSYRCGCETPLVTITSFRSTGTYHGTMLWTCPTCGLVAEVLPDTGAAS
jgi:hypothetical protein